MTRFGLWLCVAATLIADLATAQDGVQVAPSAPAATITQPVGDTLLTVDSGGFQRTAQLHLPAGYQPAAKPPLVIALHGAGGTGSGMLNQDGWAAKSDGAGFIVVAPDGLPAQPRGGPNFLTNPPLWNSGQLKPGSPRAAIDDVAFIRQLLDTLKQKYPYDDQRVFCTGHSNGGGMTFRLAAELSERLTAIGTVAGLMSLDDPHPARPLPTLYIIGTKDPLMPIDGGEVRLPWGTRQNPPLSKPLAVWAKAIRCQSEPSTLSETKDIKKVEYRSLAGGPTLTVVYLTGHGHHWPGGKRILPEALIGPITSQLDATDALWDFFAAHATTPK